MSAALAQTATLLGLLALLLLVLLFLMLAVPIALDFRCQRVQTFRAQVQIRWLFGMVQWQVRWPPAATAKASKCPGVSKMRRQARRRVNSQTDGMQAHDKRGGPGMALRMLRDAAFRHRALRLTRQLGRALHISQLSLRARVGVGDPADTGRLWALIGPLSATASCLPRIQLWIEPEFMEPTFEFNVQGSCSAVPLRVLAAVLVFGLSPVTVRSLLSARASDA